MYGRGAHGKLTDSGDWREKIDLRSHRYMLEDTRLGLSFIVSCGRWAGVPTSVAQGLLSRECGRGARPVCGRTHAERLGIAALSKDAMRALLDNGVAGVSA